MSVQRHLAEASEPADDRSRRLAQANINPTTGLATDYLNHFNEAIMLLEMLSSCPDCIDDFHAWKPLSYREHFATSSFRDRLIAIEAYDAADPSARHCLETLADTMTAVLEATRTSLANGLPVEGAAMLAQCSVTSLKVLVARAGAVINGETEAESVAIQSPQAAVDLLLKR